MVDAVAGRQAALVARVLACCEAVLNPPKASRTAPAAPAVVAAAAQKTHGKYAMARFLAKHEVALQNAAAAAATAGGGGAHGRGREGSERGRAAAQLLQTLLEQQMGSLEDVKSFMTASTLRDLGVQEEVARVLLAALP